MLISADIVLFTWVRHLLPGGHPDLAGASEDGTAIEVAAVSTGIIIVVLFLYFALKRI